MNHKPIHEVISEKEDFGINYSLGTLSPELPTSRIETPSGLLTFILMQVSRSFKNRIEDVMHGLGHEFY